MDRAKEHIRAYLSREGITARELSRRAGQADSYVKECLERNRRFTQVRLARLHPVVQFPVDIIDEVMDRAGPMPFKPWQITVAQLKARPPAANLIPVPNLGAR